VTREIQFANNFRAEQRDDVGAFREKKAGDDFFSDRRSAQYVSPFKHQDSLACFGEISGVDQAIVAAADHDRVVVLRHSVKLRVIPQGKERCGWKMQQFTGSRDIAQVPGAHSISLGTASPLVVVPFVEIDGSEQGNDFLLLSTLDVLR
jgi:hypothetical protein